MTRKRTEQITASVFNLSCSAFLPFLIGSAIGRGARFYLVAYFVKIFGTKIDYMLKRYMGRIGWCALIIVIIVMVFLQYLK